MGSQLTFTPAAQQGQPGLEESTWHEHPEGTRIAGVMDAFDVLMTGVYTWTFETVHIPPVVSEAYPTSSCVPSSTHPWVAFSENVMRSSPLDFELWWEATLPVSGTSGYFYPKVPPAGYPFAHQAVFTPAAGLEDGDYAASVAGPMDEYDNVLVPYSWGFHADSTPPHVEETVPAAGATDAYPDEPVVAWLDEPFPGLPPESLQIRDENNVLVSANLSALRREGGGFEPPPTGIEFTPLGGEFTAPAVYTATVGAVTDYCAHPVVPYSWTFTMACLFVDEGWDPTVEVVACDGQQFALEMSQSELAAEYEWQHPKGTRIDGRAPETTVTQGVSFVMDTPLPDQVAAVRVRGRDEQGCITAATA
ncbi:MAG: Ig-like domain-containing protein [Anaerolineae bacterium]|nr:Ig-like domain-containing protein [Anaerolineae bacterium]